MRALFVIAAFLLAVSPILHAEDQYADLLNLEFKQQTLHGIDANESLQDDEKLFRHNRHYLSDMLKSYSQQTLSFIGLPDQTAKFMGATIGFVTRGAKLDLNDWQLSSRTWLRMIRLCILGTNSIGENSERSVKTPCNRNLLQSDLDRSFLSVAGRASGLQ